MNITREMLGPHCRAQYDAAMTARNKSPVAERPLMNKWESQYARTLATQMRLGLIDGFEFERVTIRLAKRTRYTPDFIVFRAGKIQFHEVKGHWRDDARVKLKVAAEMNRWATFYAVTKDRSGNWQWERIVP